MVNSTNQRKNILENWIIGLLIIVLLLAGSIFLTGYITIQVLSLSTLGLLVIVFPCLTGVPGTIILFFILRDSKKAKLFHRFLFPPLLLPAIWIPIFCILAFAVQPANLFKMYIVDPIPTGVSNIKGQDISAGIDQTIYLTFNLTEYSRRSICASKGLSWDRKTKKVETFLIPDSAIPAEYKNIEWDVYSKSEGRKISEALWVSSDKSFALFSFITF